MTIAVIALAVVLLGTLVALLMSRSALGAARSEASALREQAEKATEAGERAEADAAQQRAQAEANATRARTAEAERDTARREIERVATQRTDVEQELTGANERLAEVTLAMEDVEQRTQEAAVRAQEAEADRADALAALTLVRAELAEAHGAAGGGGGSDADSGPGDDEAGPTNGSLTGGGEPSIDGDDPSGLDPLGVWALESVRLDRLWRDQLGVGGDAPSPFTIHADPTRAGVQILVDALRESSGTPVELVWSVQAMIPPAPGARVVRAVEELLAHARRADSARLEVTLSGQDIELSLRTEPDVPLPDHLVAALQAAGLDVAPDDAGYQSATLIPWPSDSVAWER